MRLLLSQAAEVRLGRQRAPQYEVGDHQVRYLRSANVVDGCLDLSDVKSMNFTPAEQAIFALEPGDVLMTEGSGSAETVGTSAVWQDHLPPPVCFQNTLLRLRPRVGVTDGRYLAWWARHAHGSGQIAAVSSGANIQHLGSDGLKRLQIDVPPLVDQRRIADFLDDRVARVDQIIAARNRQISLHFGKTSSEIEALLKYTPGGVFQIRHLSSKVGSGKTPSGGSEVYRDSGVLFLRSQNVHDDRLHLDDVAYITPEIDAEMSGTRVLGGDVLLNITGASLGRCCVVPQGLPSANVNQHVCIIRPTWVDSNLLAAALRSKSAQDQIRLLQVGGNRDGLNFEQIRGLRVRIPEHPTVIKQLCALEEAHHCASSDLRRSIDLLTEYKQALITAAVTGELDVTTAGSGIPE